MIPQRYLDDLDDLIREQMQVYDFLLPEHGTAAYKKFIQHLLYVVFQFLNDPDKQSLFIRIPVAEFANPGEQHNCDLQRQRYTDMTRSLLDCLELFTSSELLNVISVDNATSYPGEWYSPGDYFLYLSENQDYILKSRVDKQNLTFIRAKNPQPSYTPVQKRNLLQNGNVFKLTCPETPAQVGATIRKCKNLINQITENSRLCQYHQLRSYQSITYCGLAAYNVADYRCIPSLVRKCGSNWNDLIANWSTELLVVVGDSNYLYNSQSIYNRLLRRRLNKALFIGTDEPWNGIETYDFVCQEMNRYCSYNHGRFHEINYVNIRFPWLEETIHSLSDIIEAHRQFIPDSTSSRLKRLMLSIFSDARFTSESLMSYQRSENDFFTNTFENILQDVLDSDAYEAILGWFESLSFEGVNPKCQYSIDHRNDVFLHRSSYKRLISELEGVNNKIFVDIPLYFNISENVIKSIRENHFFHDISVLYYEGIENRPLEYIEHYLDLEEQKIGSDVRQFFHTSINMNVVTDQNIVSDDLLDYYTPEFYEDLYLAEGNNEYKHTAYNVLFSDGTTVEISGDVLMKQDNRYVVIPLESLFQNRDTNVTLAYYQNPGNFDELVCAYSGFPPDRNVPNISRMWRERFCDYVQNRIDAGMNRLTVLSEISHYSSIPIQRLQPYCNLDTGGMFMQAREMRLMVDFMLREGLLNQEEAQYVLAARKFSRTVHNSFGRSLKRCLFQYLVTSQISDELNVILTRCNVSVENLKNQCIYEGDIMEISMLIVLE